MMRAHGTLYLSKTAPLATVAADGTFALTLLAFDRLGSHQVEPWRITHSGLGARLWWQCYQDEIQPGTPLHVALERIRTFATPRGPEFHASVVCISTGALASMQFTNPPTEHTPCPA